MVTTSGGPDAAGAGAGDWAIMVGKWWMIQSSSSCRKMKMCFDIFTGISEVKIRDSLMCFASREMGIY